MEGGHSARVVLAAEFFVIFIFLPLAFYFHFIPLPPIPALWLVAIYCFARLMHDASFDRRSSGTRHHSILAHGKYFCCSWFRRSELDCALPISLPNCFSISSSGARYFGRC